MEVTALTREGLEAMKVPELREALKARGLDNKGLKKDLVERLLQSSEAPPVREAVALEPDPPAPEPEDPPPAPTESAEEPAAVAEPTEPTLPAEPAEQSQPAAVDSASAAEMASAEDAAATAGTDGAEVPVPADADGETPPSVAGGETAAPTDGGASADEPGPSAAAPEVPETTVAAANDAAPAATNGAEPVAANAAEPVAANAAEPELPAVVAPPGQLQSLRAEAQGLRRQHQELTSLVGQWYQSVMGLQQQAARAAPQPMAHGFPGGYPGYPPPGYGAPPGYPGGYPPPAPQPSPWQEHYTAEGHLYYYNAQTGQSSWERPPDYHPAKRHAGGVGGVGGAAGGGAKSKGPPGANLFVVRKMRRGEFDEFYDNDLREAFERFGTLLRAEITLDKDTGVSKGFGFVSYTDVGAADAAMAAMNGAMVAGRQIRIEKTSEDGRPS